MPNRFLRLVLTGAAFLAALPTYAQTLGSVVIPRNTSGASVVEYAIGTTYPQGQYITYTPGGLSCVSLQGGNVGHTPALLDTTYWSCGVASLASVTAEQTARANADATEVTNRNTAISTAISQSAVGKVNGKGPGGNGASVNLTPFDLGVTVGPGAGSSGWYTQAETCGTACDTIQGFLAYNVPVTSHTFQVAFCNRWGQKEFATGPDMQITASIEYPIDSKNFYSFAFQNGRHAGFMAAGNCMVSDPLEMDISSGSSILYVRWHATRTADSALSAFGANHTNGYISGSTVLAPFTTTTASNRFDGVEEMATYDATASTGHSSGLTATCSASGTAVTFGANLIGTNSTNYTEYNGSTVTITGAGASGANLTTTVTMTGQAAGTLATACTTAVSAAATTLVPADKTASTTLPIFDTYQANEFAPFALLAAPSTSVVRSFGLVGDSITYGQGADNKWGSWAVQALDLTDVNNGLATSIKTNIPYVNASQPSELLAFLNFPGNHLDRFFLLSRVKHVMGMLGTNDLSNGYTQAQIEANFLSFWTSETARGTIPHYGTIIPHTTSSDNLWTNQADQTIPSASIEAIRVGVNDWLRDGAPYDCSTSAAATTGSTANTVVRLAYYNTSGIGTASHPASVGSAATCTHPAGGGTTFELSNWLESNSSGTPTQDGGYFNTSITDTNTGSRTTGRWTVDGTHPTNLGHATMATAANQEVVQNVTF